MKFELKPVPEDLKQNLYKIPYKKTRKFNFYMPILIIFIIAIFSILVINQNDNKDIEYIGPADGDVMLPSEFSIISKERIKVYLNSDEIEPKKEGEFYIFEKHLSEGEYKLEIVLSKNLNQKFILFKSKALRNRNLIKWGFDGGEAPNQITGIKKRSFENKGGWANKL